MMTKLGFATISLLMTTAAHADMQELTVSMLLPGNIADHGFMEAGCNGLLQVQKDFGAKISYVDGVEPKPELLTAALRRMAADNPDLIIAHGGQNNKAAQ